MKVRKIWKCSRKILFEFREGRHNFVEPFLRERMFELIEISPSVFFIASYKEPRLFLWRTLIHLAWKTFILFWLNDYMVNIQCYFFIALSCNLIDIRDEAFPNSTSMLWRNPINNDSIVFLFFKINGNVVPEHILVDKFLLRVEVELFFPNIPILIVIVGRECK